MLNNCVLKLVDFNLFTTNLKGTYGTRDENTIISIMGETSANNRYNYMSVSASSIYLGHESYNQNYGRHLSEGAEIRIASGFSNFEIANFLRFGWTWVDEENYLIKKSTLVLMATILREQGQLSFSDDSTPYDLIKSLNKLQLVNVGADCEKNQYGYILGWGLSNDGKSVKQVSVDIPEGSSDSLQVIVGTPVTFYNCYSTYVEEGYFINEAGMVLPDYYNNN